MTDPPRVTRAAIVPSATGELRLYLTAGLALAYVLVWWALVPVDPPAVVAEAEPAAADPAIASGGEPAAVVWYRALPPAQRPALQLPAGWQLVDPAVAPIATAPPAVRRVPARRTRIRTRSS